MARLDCTGSQPFLVRAEPSRVEVFPMGDEVAVPWAQAQVQAQLKEELPEGAKQEISVRAVGAWRLLTARVSDENGPCGGTDFLLAGLYDPAGNAIFPLRRFEFATVEGVVDVGRDGRPELLVSQFPEIVQVVAADGSVVGAREVAFCDCAC